jgi:hypothetical protein
MEKTSISVSIDLTDEFEKELFQHVMSKGARKKSGYIKRLIHADMLGIRNRELTTTVMDDVEDDDRRAMMDSF